MSQGGAGSDQGRWKVRLLPSMPDTALTLPSCFPHSVEMTLFLHLFLGSLLFQSPEGGSLKTWPP